MTHILDFVKVDKTFVIFVLLMSITKCRNISKKHYLQEFRRYIYSFKTNGSIKEIYETN